MGWVRQTSGRAVLLLLLGAAIASTAPQSVTAQDSSSTPEYPLLLTATRAQAIAKAIAEDLDYIPGEVLVKFKGGTTTAGQTRALAAMRSRPTASNLRWVGEVAVLRDVLEDDATVLAEQLRRAPEVEYAEPNYLYKMSAAPNDPGFAQSQWNFKALDLPRAWDINAGGSTTMVIAVIDSGVNTVNQTFTFQNWNAQQQRIQNVVVPFAVNPDMAVSRLTLSTDFVFWNGPVLDMVGHGTHVSSTVGEDTNNNLAEAGIAYRSKIMPLKVCIGYWETQFALSSAGIPGFASEDDEGCPTDAVAQAVRFAADNGAKILNLSLGGEQPSITLRDALRYAVSKGAFVAIAAGNNHDEGNAVEYPAAYAQDIDGVMSVAAVGPSLNRAYYSTTGPQIEIAAPGGNDREGGAAGLIWHPTTLVTDRAPRLLNPRFNQYFETGQVGTSMASPHVAGIAALIASQGVTSPAAIEALIRRTARDLGTAGRDPEYGFGLIQPVPSLFGFGVGR